MTTTDRYKTYCVAGSVYTGGREKNARTHTYDQETQKPLCRRVKEHLLDDELWGGEGCTERAPDCPVCLSRDPRFRKAKPTAKERALLRKMGIKT